MSVLVKTMRNKTIPGDYLYTRRSVEGVMQSPRLKVIAVDTARDTITVRNSEGTEKTYSMPDLAGIVHFRAARGRGK